VAAVVAADDGHGVPVVVASDHDSRPVVADHDAEQAPHVTTMRLIATNCPSALCANPSEGVGRGRWNATIAQVRTAVITGGSSGIGLAVARILARRGGWQIVLAARREEPLAVAAAELGAVAVRCDVTDDADVAGLVAEAADLGGCDLLVHAAGAPARAKVLEAELATYRAALEVNYIGLVRVGTAFWPLLETSRGRFVPVISIAGAVALAPAAPYGASKAAALSWARSYGAAAREHGVALTIVNPGPVATPGFPQTALLDSRFRRLLVIDAERCAERLLAAADRRAAEVYVPQWWRIVAAFQGAAPGITASVAARAWRHGAYPAPEPVVPPA
jgi:short-subunit dehydrogenase